MAVYKTLLRRIRKTQLRSAATPRLRGSATLRLRYDLEESQRRVHETLRLCICRRYAMAKFDFIGPITSEKLSNYFI